MATVDVFTIDTRSGLANDNPFSPPADWEGDGDAYVQLLRERFGHDPWLRQWLGILALRVPQGHQYTVIGPWQREIDRVVASVINKIKALNRADEEASHG